MINTPVYSSSSAEDGDRPLIDLFTTSLNHKLPTFSHRSWNQRQKCWTRCYIVGQPSSVHFATNYFDSSDAEQGSEVSDRDNLDNPVWSNQEWFSDLLASLIESPRKLPSWDRLPRQTHMKSIPPKTTGAYLTHLETVCQFSKIKVFETVCRPNYRRSQGSHFDTRPNQITNILGLV